ncbi:MAG: hypothetical protein ABEJ99_05115, partial [Candidatus Nanohaloarchaea archaeon]
RPRIFISRIFISRIKHNLGFMNYREAREFCPERRFKTCWMPQDQQKQKRTNWSILIETTYC